jgi:beta-glucosidase
VLQGGQAALLEALAKTGTPTVVVLAHSKPSVLPPAALGAAGLIEAFNTGMRPALETTQVYISDLVTSVTWAERELKAWRQVEVDPGESVRVELEVPASACSLVTADGRRVVEPGEFEVQVGPSSRPADLLRARVRIDGAG